MPNNINNTKSNNTLIAFFAVMMLFIIGLLMISSSDGSPPPAVAAEAIPKESNAQSADNSQAGKQRTLNQRIVDDISKITVKVEKVEAFHDNSPYSADFIKNVNESMKIQFKMAGITDLLVENIDYIKIIKVTHGDLNAHDNSPSGIVETDNINYVLFAKDPSDYSSQFPLPTQLETPTVSNVLNKTDILADNNDVLLNGAASFILEFSYNNVTSESEAINFNLVLENVDISGKNAAGYDSSGIQMRWLLGTIGDEQVESGQVPLNVYYAESPGNLKLSPLQLRINATNEFINLDGSNQAQLYDLKHKDGNIIPNGKVYTDESAHSPGFLVFISDPNADSGAKLLSYNKDSDSDLDSLVMLPSNDEELGHSTVHIAKHKFDEADELQDYIRTIIKTQKQASFYDPTFTGNVNTFDALAPVSDRRIVDQIIEKCNIYNHSGSPLSFSDFSIYISK
jgi:hypothetical protein